MSELTGTLTAEMIQAIQQIISNSKDELNQLDSALGDGDHGTGISTALEDASQKVAELNSPTPTDVFKTTALSLMNRMGGASGALFGTLFLKMSTTTKDKTVLSHTDFASALQAGIEGVKQRGKSDLGDKTMLDALIPAGEAFAEADNFMNGFQSAMYASQNGVEQTRDMVAKHGRAKFIGERAIGHPDAGATSVAKMFQAIYDYWETRN